MKFSELKNELDNEQFRNLYIFTGPETEVMNRYIKRIGPKASQAASFESIQPRLTAKGLFDTQGVFVLHDDKTTAEMDYKALQGMVGSKILILVYKDIDKRKKLFKTAGDNIVEFERFSSDQLIWYVQKIIDVPENLALMIAEYSGNDVARIENECNKLQMCGKEINEELVKELIYPPLEERIFDMIDFIAKKRMNEAFTLYRDLLELNTSPIQILSILYTKWKHVFLVQSYHELENNKLAAKTGLTFFQVNMTRALIGAFTLEDILYFMIRTQEAEVAIKTGKLDQYVAMDALLVETFI